MLKCEVFCYTLDGDDMLKRIVEKRNYIILFIIIILIIWIVWNAFLNKKEPYIETFNYYGEEITFKVYDKVDHKKLTEDINNIYEKYEDVDALSGKLNEDEKALIEYGKLVYYKTDGYTDITSGELLKHLKNNEDYNFKSEIEKLQVYDDKLVNEINFNFDNMIGSYATNDVLYYFKQNNITKYIVNENGDIATGTHYDNGKYTISINNPNNEEILEVLELENKAIATRNKTDNFQSYMVNPKTSKKENKYDSVLVIANDNLTANMLVNAIYLMDEEKGKKLIEEYPAEALWIDGDKIIKTDGFDNYVQKD